ncbi:MAG: slipin family protein [Actinomycetota bacterium]
MQQAIGHAGFDPRLACGPFESDRLPMIGSFELVVLILLPLVVAFVARVNFKKVTVFEYEKGLKYHKGKFQQALGPGTYWISASKSVVRNVDIRPRFAVVPGQDVMSSDGVTLRVSLAARYQVVKPEVAVNQIEDYIDALYLTLQLALRDVVGGTTIEQVLETRSQLSERLLELTREPVGKLGLNLMSVNIRDIMFPGELKRIFTQVVEARQEGLAALERARGETAALRSLANAAKMAADNPTLLQLRLLQQLGESGGNSVILGYPGFGAPLPVVAGEQKAPPKESGDS